VTGTEEPQGADAGARFVLEPVRAPQASG